MRKEAELPLLFVVHHAPPITDPDSFPVSVMVGILGGGDSARLNQKVVYEKQLASYAGADYNPLHVDPEFARKTEFGERPLGSPFHIVPKQSMVIHAHFSTQESRLGAKTDRIFLVQFNSF